MYQSKNYDHLIGIEGMSEGLLNNHFALYAGYVANTNKLIETLERLRNEEKEMTPEYAETKRRFGWEWNGMRLHELYFDGLAKERKVLAEGAALSQKIGESFGSLAAWEKDWRATGAMRGIGWVALVVDEATGKLFNTWIAEHNGGHLAGGKILLVMDVFEHAFMLDYGMKRPEYIDVFMKSIDWEVVDGRMEK